MENEQRFLRAAIDLARENLARGGRPFGAVIVKDGAIIASGVNEILSTNDPTTHAEPGAIRAASRAHSRPTCRAASSMPAAIRAQCASRRCE